MSPPSSGIKLQFDTNEYRSCLGLEKSANSSRSPTCGPAVVCLPARAIHGFPDNLPTAPSSSSTSPTEIS